MTTLAFLAIMAAIFVATYKTVDIIADALLVRVRERRKS